MRSVRTISLASSWKGLIGSVVKEETLILKNLGTDSVSFSNSTNAEDKVKFENKILFLHHCDRNFLNRYIPHAFPKVKTIYLNSHPHHCTVLEHLRNLSLTRDVFVYVHESYWKYIKGCNFPTNAFYRLSSRQYRSILSNFESKV